MTLIAPSDSRTWLAQRARDLAAGRNVLFHGTRHPEQVVRDARLRKTWPDPAVCFSRSADVAAYWATLERRGDEGRGAVLIFDRDRLAMRYRLEAYDYMGMREEFEERVVDRDIPLDTTLLGIIAEPFVHRTAKERYHLWNTHPVTTTHFGNVSIHMTRAITEIIPPEKIFTATYLDIKSYKYRPQTRRCYKRKYSIQGIPVAVEMLYFPPRYNENDEPSHWTVRASKDNTEN